MVKQTEMPELKLQRVHTWDGEFTFTGRVLGYATSEVEHHTHPVSELPAPGRRCSGCRWFEVTIYSTPDTSTEARYCVYTVGNTRLEGEDARRRTRWTDSPYEVVEMLNVRDSRSAPFLPGPSARALAQAAEYDDGLYDAYHNRVVA